MYHDLKKLDRSKLFQPVSASHIFATTAIETVQVVSRR